MLSTIKSYVIDDATALKVHNIGITDILLNTILIYDNIDMELIISVADVLNYITRCE